MYPHVANGLKITTLFPDKTSANHLIVVGTAHHLQACFAAQLVISALLLIAKALENYPLWEQILTPDSSQNLQIVVSSTDLMPRVANQELT